MTYVDAGCPECESTSPLHLPRCQFDTPSVNPTLEWLLAQDDDFHMCRAARGVACPVCHKHARYCGHTKADMVRSLTNDTEPAPPGERWPTLARLGLLDSLDAIEAVAAWNQDKHGRKWVTKTISHHDAKAIKHLGTTQCGETFDAETGLRGRAHAGLRVIMALGLELLGGRR